MNWTQVNIYTSTEGIEPLSFELLGIGINGFVIKDNADFKEFLENKTGKWDYIDEDLMGLSDCETCVTVYLPEDSQGADMLTALKSALAKLAERDTDKLFGRLEIEMCNVREEDWANNWKQYFKPFNVGERLLVKPSWEETLNEENRIILEIDPASSFGTGQHNTTRLCMEFLEGCVSSDSRILDLGCGSGILSIAAMLLGAQCAYAVDIAKNAAETAAENAAKNHINPEAYKTFCGDILEEEVLADSLGTGFDIITANIVSDVLIAMSGLFRRFLKPDGILIVSGIITERTDEVTEAIIKNNFKLIETIDKDGWAAVKFKMS